MQEMRETEEYIDVTDLETQKSTKENWFWSFLDSRYFVVLCFILVSTISFFLGRISKSEELGEPIKIIYPSEGEILGVSTENNLETKESTKVPKQTNQRETSGMVLGSKNGNKYHYPWCAGAKQISEENKVYFKSIEEAISKGYTKALNCKGLK